MAKITDSLGQNGDLPSAELCEVLAKRNAQIITIIYLVLYFSYVYIVFMNREDIKFPVKTPLKVFVENIYSLSEAKRIFEEVCKNNGTEIEEFRDKLSKNGAFVSYTILVELKSLEMLESVFSDLGKVKGVKTVI